VTYETCGHEAATLRNYGAGGFMLVCDPCDAESEASLSLCDHDDEDAADIVALNAAEARHAEAKEMARKAHEAFAAARESYRVAQAQEALALAAVTRALRAAVRKA
jgi:hypothetical protein